MLVTRVESSEIEFPFDNFEADATTSKRLHFKADAIIYQASDASHKLGFTSSPGCTVWICNQSIYSGGQDLMVIRRLLIWF